MDGLYSAGLPVASLLVQDGTERSKEPAGSPHHLGQADADVPDGS
ncbi:hypothetical protein ACPB9J_06020 [Streptomyces lavendulocolor]